MATIEEINSEVLLTKQVASETKVKVDSLTLFVEAYPAMTNEIPLTITLSDGITQVDNLKKQSETLQVQVDNFLNPDPLIKVIYSDGSDGNNLAKIAELAGADIHSHDNKTFLDTLTSFKTIKGISILGSGDISFNEFSGDYSDLTNTPTFATINGQTITNGGNILVATAVFDYTNLSNPTATTNPTKDNAIWLNTTSGEIFICTDKTVDNNVWQGTNGTIIGGFSDNNPLGDSTQICYYKFENNLLDELGSFNGTNSNVTFVLSQVGQGGYFNGTSSKVTNSITALTDFSIVGWFNSSDVSALGCIVVEDGGYNNHVEIMSSTQIRVNINGTDHLFTVSLSNNTWYHFAVVRSGTVLYLYLNNQLINSEACSNTSIAWNKIGVRGDSVQWFVGIIDQLRWFNRALTGTEISTLYNLEV